MYRLFGINAELLIDHAWGWEPCTIADIKAYKPASNSVGSGQVLPCAIQAKSQTGAAGDGGYAVAGSVDRCLVTDQLVLTVGYDRTGPKNAHGTENLGQIRLLQTDD